MAIATCPKCGAKNRVDESRAADAQPVCGRCGTQLDASASSDGGSGGAAHPREFTDDTFARELEAAGDRPVLVDAWAAWCPPCRMIAPTIDQIAAESSGRWVIGKLDVDANPATAQRFRIGSIPTLLIFRRGQLVSQMVGVQPKAAIVAKLQEHTA